MKKFQTSKQTKLNLEPHNDKGVKFLKYNYILIVGTYPKKTPPLNANSIEIKL